MRRCSTSTASRGPPAVAAVVADVQAERRPQRVPQPGVPGLELAVEVAARVALAARVHAGRAARLERGVDAGRHGLVGRGPVAVAAAEDRVADPGRRRRGVVDPGAELRPRCPAAGRCRRTSRPRRRRRSAAPRRPRRARRCGRCSPGRSRRGRSGWRCPPPRRGWTRTAPAAGCRGGRPVRRRARGTRGLAVAAAAARRRAPGAPATRGATVIVSPVGLEGQRLLDLELVVRVVDELEPLQDHAEHQRRLLQRELAPDAGPLPRAERPERVRAAGRRGAPGRSGPG